MRRVSVVACVLVLGPPHLLAQERVDYSRDIKPLLKERCIACHGALKQKARLRLDTAEAMRRGGKSGPAIIPGQPEKSLLLERICAAEGERMPPEGKPLTARQIAFMRAWIQQGAPAPADERADADARRHWAFQRPLRPALPVVKNAGWVRNPIDAFVASVHEEKGLFPGPPADRETLLRRVYLDLAGLPPTRAELHVFVADQAPDAYEKVVDRLLASPLHAERWARHWMDIWRYSDWYGSRHINELRNSRRHIWRWRDWLIEAIDGDKGYDRMILEMLAGDELAPGDLDVQRASGYLGRNFYVFNRSVWLHDTVEYMASAMLGLTLKCCRCHDHKYDPISQEEYYRLRAFFEPHRVRTDPIAGKAELLKGNIAAGSPAGTNLKDGLDCVYDGDMAPTYLFLRGSEKDPVKDRPLEPGVPTILGGKVSIAPVSLPLAARYPMLRPEHVDEMLGRARGLLAAATASLGRAADANATAVAEKQLALARAGLVSLEARIAADKAKYDGRSSDAVRERLCMTASSSERAEALCRAELDLVQAEQQVAHLQTGKTDPKNLQAARARVSQQQAKVAQARTAAQEASTRYTPLGAVYPSTSSGRRLALARWIACKENPLTARVAVNHIWLRHFGSALVPSVQNVGRNGKPPTHPRLLDWLATEFMERGWSMKAIHRLIVTSNTYRLASTGMEQNYKLDPENQYLWRANVRRMEAEVVRDSLLHLAGTLDCRRGGEDLDPALDARLPRRSLYFRHTPDEKPLLLEIFDAANPSECFERTESIMPQQALALVNGDFSHSQARLMARKLHASPELQANDEAFVAAAFELVLSRKPAPAEVTPCLPFLREQAARLTNSKKLTPAANATTASAVPPSADPRLRARENLVHVLLNYNEFATIR
jgi:hypothetical protein